MVALGEIMTREPYTTARDTPVCEVAKALLKGRFGSALVMDGSWLVGIFTERDVLRAAAAGANVLAVSVAEWMTSDPVTVGPDMDSEEAADLMLSQGFRHLPVTEGKNVIGIVSLRDILSTRIRRSSS